MNVSERGESKCRKSYAYGEPSWLITLPFARNGGGAITADVGGHFQDNGVVDRHFNGTTCFLTSMLIVEPVVVAEFSLSGKKTDKNHIFPSFFGMP